MLIAIRFAAQGLSSKHFACEVWLCPVDQVDVCPNAQNAALFNHICV